MTQSFDTELEEVTAKFTRELSQAVSALILKRLGIGKSAAKAAGATTAAPKASAKKAAAAAAAPAAPKPKGKRGAAKGAGKKTKTGAPRRKRSTEAERLQMLDNVHKAVAAQQGMAAGEIERATKLSKPIVAAALRQLKEQGKVFMGGTKRFARYATSQEAADSASADAKNKAQGGAAAA